jgi:hypothetical protein
LMLLCFRTSPPHLCHSGHSKRITGSTNSRSAISKMTTKERTKKLACAFKSLKCSSRAVDDESSLYQSHRERKHDPMPKDVAAVWNAAVAKRNVGTRNVMKSSATHSTESSASEPQSVKEGLWMPINGSGGVEHGFGSVFDVLERAPAKSPSGESLGLCPQQQLQRSQKEEKQQISSTPSADMILPTPQTESSSTKLRHECSKPVVERPAAVALCPCLSLDKIENIDKIPEASSFTEEGNENREGTSNGPLHNIASNGENTSAMFNRDILYQSPSASLTKESQGVLLLPNTPPYDQMISTTMVIDSAATTATLEGRSLADSITTLDDSTSATDSRVQDELRQLITRHTVWMTHVARPLTPPVMDIDPKSAQPEIEKGTNEHALANTLLEAQTQQETSFPNREASKMVQSNVNPIEAPRAPPPLRPPRLKLFAKEIKVSERDDSLPAEKKRPNAYLNALNLAPRDAALTFGFRDRVEIHRSATKTTIVTQLTPGMFPGWPSTNSGTETSTGTESSFSSISSFADVAGMEQSNRLTSQCTTVVNKHVVHKPSSFFWRTHPKVTVRSDDKTAVPKLHLAATDDLASFDDLFFTKPDNQFDLQDGTKGIAVLEPYLRPSIVREMWMDSKPPRPRATLGR